MRGETVDHFLAGVPYDAADLRDPRTQMSWDHFCTLAGRLAAHVGPDGLHQIGRALNSAPTLRGALSTLSLVASPRVLYAVAARRAAALWWPMCSSTITHVGPNRLQIEVRLPLNTRPCPSSFRLSAGALETLPRAVGLDESTVHAHVEERRAVFDVMHPPSATLWARLRRMLAVPWGSQAMLEAQQVQISELNLRLRELDETRRRAEAAEAVRLDFLSNISHELRTPLNAIYGAIDSLTPSTLTADQRTEVSVLQQASDRLLRMIDNTLDLSHLSAGRFSLHPTPTALKPLLEEAFTHATGAVGQKSVSVSLLAEAGLPATATLDPGRLPQVLHHLLDNAAKFTTFGQVTLQARTIPHGGQLALELTVSDTGAGIDPAYQEAIFVPFSQQDSSQTRSAEGAGLGLALSRSLIAAMGGTLSVESTPGSGTTFTVVVPTEATGPRLPALSLRHVPAAPAASAAQQAPGETTSQVKVLVVEDNQINQVVIRRLLSQLGLEVVLANDGLEGVAEFQSGRYALVLMDIQMPNLDGFGATEQIRRMPGGEEVPIIAVTANDHPGYREECLSRGMDAYVAKPVRPDTLADAIRQFLQLQALAQA